MYKCIEDLVDLNGNIYIRGDIITDKAYYFLSYTEKDNFIEL